MIVTCILPLYSWKLGDFDPFPGGQKARAMGCTCPYQPYENGTITFDADCKVHPPSFWREGGGIEQIKEGS